MDLTRRGLLSRAAAGSAGLLGAGLAGPQVVFAGSDGEAVFEARVPRGSADGGGWTSGAITPKRSFELVGIELGPAPSAAQIRGRGIDGRWSEWVRVQAGHEHGPDRAYRGRPSTGRSAAGERASTGRSAAGGRATLSDPIWVGPSDALEIRSTHSLRGARLLLVDSGRPATASAANRYADAGLPAAAGQPRIIARSTWATRACRPRAPAVFGSVQLAFVHHTVSSNYYRPSQSAAMVRSICLFHKYGNGWNDIGYNFVVDRYGQVFEARQGGVDEAIIGAQAGGYNAFSTGVALLGTFSGGGPGRSTFDSLARLLAWKLAIHGIEVPGRVTVRVTRDGSGYSRYRAGASVLLNRIAGHRDADTTECPGTGMYRQLPRLRQVVARQIGTVSRLTAGVQAVAPGGATLGGLLTADAGPIGGATVEIQQHSSTAAPALIATATTNPDGTWAVTVPLATNAQLRAVYRGGPDAAAAGRRGAHAAASAPAAAVSLNVPVAVPPQIVLSATTQATIAGGVIEFDGSTSPAKPRVTVVVAQQQADGSFATVRSIRTGTNPDGTFSRSIGFPDPGQYQVVAHTPADGQNAIGTSPPIAITVA